MAGENNKRLFGAPSLVPLVGLLAGWLVSIPLILGSEFYVTGALIPAGIAMSLGLLSGVILAAFKSLDSLFRLEHLLMVGLFFWLILDAAQGAYNFYGTTSQAIVTAFNATAVFAVAIWVGSYLMGQKSVRVPEFEAVRTDALFLFWAGVVCFVLGMLKVFIACRLSPGCIVGSLFAPRFGSAWATADIGYFDTILRQLRYFGFLVLPLAVALQYVQRRITWRVVVLGILGLIFLMILIQGGGRRQVGMVLASAALVWALLHRPLRVKHMVVLAAICGAVLYLLQVMIESRSVLIPILQTPEVFQPENSEYGAREGFIHIDKNLYYFSQITDRVPAQYDHTGWTGIYYILTAPIPRTVVPDKPVARGFPLVSILGLRKSASWSWTCSAVCDFYLIGGYFAIVVGGMLFGAAANLGNRLLSEPITVRKVMLYGIVALTLFISLRAAHEITKTGFAVLALWGLFYIRRLASIRRWVRSRVST